MQKLTDDYSEKQHLPSNQAEIKVKEAIVDEEVDPTFLTSVGGMIRGTANAVTDACVIM